LCGDEVEARKWPVLATIFYPFAITTMAAGLLAFVMILLKPDDLLLIATAVLWFYFFSAAAIYVISKNVLRVFGLHRFFFGLTVTMGVLALLSAIILGLRISGHF
jgi:hypothetical protein